jgi:hypothetical protein
VDVGGSNAANASGKRRAAIKFNKSFMVVLVKRGRSSRYLLEYKIAIQVTIELIDPGLRGRLTAHVPARPDNCAGFGSFCQY